MLLSAAGMREEGATITGEQDEIAVEERKQPVKLAEAGM